jgi:hypothetical protein
VCREDWEERKCGGREEERAGALTTSGRACLSGVGGGEAGSASSSSPSSDESAAMVLLGGVGSPAVTVAMGLGRRLAYMVKAGDETRGNWTTAEKEGRRAGRAGPDERGQRRGVGASKLTQRVDASGASKLQDKLATGDRRQSENTTEGATTYQRPARSSQRPRLNLCLFIASRSLSY